MARQKQESAKPPTRDERDENVLKFSRDENGLLKNVSYVFRGDGSVDWKAMIPKEYIFLNESYFIKNNMEIPESPEGVEDKGLIIGLAGLKEVLKIRGLVSRETSVIKAEKDRVVCTCKLKLIPNYETNGQEMVYEEVANASIYNVDVGFQVFMETIASNRAFARAIRNALRIDIVGDAELSDSHFLSSSVEGNGIEPWRILAQECKKIKSIVRRDPSTKNPVLDENGEKIKDWINTFEGFKALVIRKEPAAIEWTEWKDIPTERCIIYLSALKEIEGS